MWTRSDSGVLSLTSDFRKSLPSVCLPTFLNMRNGSVSFGAVTRILKLLAVVEFSSHHWQCVPSPIHPRAFKSMRARVPSTSRHAVFCLRQTFSKDCASSANKCVVHRHSAHTCDLQSLLTQNRQFVCGYIRQITSTSTI